MDSATSFATVAILLLQLLLLYLVLDVRSKVGRILKSRGNPSDSARKERPEAAPSRPFNGKGSSRQPSPPRNRDKPPAPKPAPSVDKSLRDINLRLKSAERDQAQARKSIRGAVDPNENSGKRSGKEGGRSQKEGGRSQKEGKRSRRGGRRRDSRRKPDRDRNRDQRNSRKPQRETKDSQTAPSRESSGSQAPVVEKRQEVEHGRKVVVKRRTLPGENPSEKEDRNKESSSGLQEPNNGKSGNTQSDFSGGFESENEGRQDTEQSYGRR